MMGRTPLQSARGMLISKCLLHFWREGDRSRWEVLDIMLNPGVPHLEAIEAVDESEK